MTLNNDEDKLHPGAAELVTIKPGDDAPDAEAQQRLTRRKQVASSMLKAGIPKMFCRENLSITTMFGKQGEQILRCLDDPEFKVRMKLGAGFSVETKTQKDWDILPMMTRAMLLSNIDARFMRIQHIAAWLDDPELEDTRFEALPRARAFVIQQLYTNDPAVGDEAPLPRQQMYRVESWLRDQFESGVSISYGYTGNLLKQKWWTENFIHALQQHTVKVID